MPRILVFAGSPPQDSLNRRLANAAAEALRALGGTVTQIDLSDYPLPAYGGEVDAAEGLPAAARALRALIREHAAMVIAAPEERSSLGTPLRNTLDWIAHPEGTDVGPSPCRNKIALLLAAAPAALDGLHGLQHLRDTLEGLGVLVLPQTLVLGHAEQAFDTEGRLDDSRATFLLNLSSKLLRIASALQS